MAYDLRRESLKSLFLITRLAFAFLNLLVAGALGQQIEASDHSSKSESSDHKEAEKEHHEEEKNEEDQKVPRVDPRLIYLYSKILLLVIITSVAFAILVTAVSRADFWRI